MGFHGCGRFIDFYECPLCHNHTRYYEKDTNQRNRHYREIFCEKCGLVRLQTLSSFGWVFGTKDNGAIQYAKVPI